MADKLQVAVVVGSLRKASLSRKVANAVIELAPPSFVVRPIELGDLPLYNEDLEALVPQPWQRFRDEIRAVDGVLFVTAEYNRSVPGLLKNAIDVGSRPYGKSAWSGKPAAVISQSPGSLGGFGSNHHLRQMMVFLDMPAMPQPEIYLSHSNKLFDEAGKLNADGTRQLLTGMLQKFETWIRRFTPGGAASG